MNVVFIIFNRPSMTQQVFDAIAQVRPERLFVVADGPRPSRIGDVAKVKAVREIVDHIDWPCKVLRNYSEVNLGCMRRVESGLDWVFSEVEDAIILEDDCLPHPDFFRFCTEMLGRYRDDQRVGHICGTNFDGRFETARNTYSFSIYSSIWGWATWKRCWKEYDSAMQLWPKLREQRFHYNVFPTRKEASYFEKLWDDLYGGHLNAWGGRWLFARLVHGTVSVRPSVNLISNIGFGENVDATHTTFAHGVGHCPVEGLVFPLNPPSAMIVNREADCRYASVFFGSINPLWRGFKDRFLNRYWYGKLIRGIPLAGSIWATIRSRRRVDSASLDKQNR